MDEIIEMGTISARGQICIPSNIREQLGLEEGSKVFFTVKDKTIMMKSVKNMSWDEVTQPLRDAMAKTSMKESDVVDLIHRMRKEKKPK
jgi:AbrB family looped-hinge helix DNA binding protein